MIAHVFDDILAKGATRNANTQVNEQMHGPLKDSYEGRINFKDIAGQVSTVNVNSADNSNYSKLSH